MYQFNWSNVTVEISDQNRGFWKSRGKPKTILHNSSVQSNKFVAVMGSSGSGKTSLLQSLAGRLALKTGTFKINSKPIKHSDITRISKIVDQIDVFVEVLTVYEHLLFVTALILRNVREQQRNTLINGIIHDFGLNKSRNTLIRYLSGGERRRLSVAESLISDPLIVFCDEPTTGLDSYNAAIVVRKLQSIAATSKKIVIASIHQPSSELFECFDNLILMSHGRIVFSGTKFEAKTYFETRSLKCPENYNPAEFYINNIMNIDDVLKKQIKGIHKCNNNVSEDFVIDTNEPKKTYCTFFVEFYWLFWRFFLALRRNFLHDMAGSWCLLITGLILAIIYAPVPINDGNIYQNVKGLLLLVNSEIIFCNIYMYLYTFPHDLVVFVKEKQLYASLPYFMARCLTLIPSSFVISGLYLAIYFAFVHFFTGFYLFIKLWYIIFCCGLSGCIIGLSISALFPKIEYMDVIMNPLELVLMLMSGGFVELSTLPPVCGWIRYLSPFFYSLKSSTSIYWDSQENSTIIENYFRTENDSVGNIYVDVLNIHILMFFYGTLGFIGVVRKRY